MKPITSSEAIKSSSTTSKTEKVTPENVVTDKPEVVPLKTDEIDHANGDKEENVEDADPEHAISQASQSESSGVSYVHLNLMVIAIVIGAAFL